MTYSSKSKGFSLVELLVVIAIVGLLASVALASLTQSRRQADAAKALGDFRAVGQALELFHQANGGQYPDGSDGMPVDTLVTAYLSEYLQNKPQMPASLLGAGTPVYYYSLPTDAGYYYSCGDAAGTDQYVLTFVGSGDAQNSGNFPRIYERAGDTGPFTLMAGPENLCIPLTSR